MESSNINKGIQDVTNPKEALQVDVPIGMKQHSDSDLHLIGETLPEPSRVSEFTSVAAVGQSPNPAREDHAHNLADGTAAAPSLGWGDLGFYKVSAGVVGLAVNGNNRFSWDGSRFYAPNIQLGAWASSPSYAIVEGQGAAYLLLGSTGADKDAYLRADTGEVNIGAGGADRIVVGTSTVTITPTISCNAISSGQITANAGGGTPINVGAVSGYSHSGVESPHGYLLLGHNGVNGSLYLRTKSAWPVHIGQENSNTISVYNGYALTNSQLRTGFWESDGSWNAAVSGNTGYLLLGHSAGGSTGAYLRTKGSGRLRLGASGNYIETENHTIMALPDWAGSGFNVVIDVSGIIEANYSKRELKEEIVPLDPKISGSRIDALNPVSFIFKPKNPNHITPESEEWRKKDLQYGLIAEEVADVDPHLAIWQFLKDEEGEFTGEAVPGAWYQDKMIALLILEAKELRKRVSKLEDMLTAKAGF